MNTTNNTVLVTGGSTGIGFAIAKLLSEQGNRVIITGRDEMRLQQASLRLSNVTTIKSDVTSDEDVIELVKKLEVDFPGLSMLVNNAGRAFVHDLSNDGASFGKAGQEMATNYLAVINLTEKLLPLLKQQSASAIVNVSSIAAITPNHKLATYAASKAALHSYTQSLRYTLTQHSTIKVFELMPPLVDTDFSQEIGGHNGIAPSVVADDLLTALNNDTYEIHVGGTAQLYNLYLSSPAAAFEAMNAKR